MGVGLLSEYVVKKYIRIQPNVAHIFRRGDIADAEPAVPKWKMAVDDLFVS